MDNIFEEDLAAEQKVRGDRIMKSDAARQHRKEIKSILNTRQYKEEKERKELLKKHYDLLKAKKRKQKRNVMVSKKV